MFASADDSISSSVSDFADNQQPKRELKKLD